MLDAGLVEDGLEVGRAGGKARLVQRPVQRTGIRNQDAEVAAFEAGRDLEGNADVAFWLLPGAEGGFHDHRVSGVNDVGAHQPGGFQLDLDAAGNGLDVEVDGAERSLACAVGVETLEAGAGEQGEHQRGGLCVAGRGPLVERRGGIAVEVDGAGEVIAGFGGALIGFEQGVVEGDQQGLGGERGQVENLHVQLAAGAGGVDVDVNGNHVRLCAEHPADRGVAVLGEGSDQVAGVDDFESVQRRSQRDHHFGCGHGQGDGAGLQDGVAAGEELFGVDVGDGAGGGDFDVAANQLGADRRAGDDGGQGGGRGVRVEG